MFNDKYKRKILERIANATREMFSSWESLDKSPITSQGSLKFSQNIDELLKKEFENTEEEIEIKKTVENRIRTRKDLGEIITGNRVIKKIQINDSYIKDTKPLKSIAYYQLLPEMDAKTPLVQVLRWTISQPPCWTIWYTSPIFKGSKIRTKGEYIVAHSLTEKESEDYNLLMKLSHFTCFCTNRGIDILLSFKDLYEAIKLVEKFLPSIIERNLYSDPEFLQFLKEYKQKEINSFLERNDSL